VTLLAWASMVVVLVADVNDGAARQQGLRGRHNNQIKATAVKMAFDCSGISREDGIQLQWQQVTARRKKQSINK
jgi:hypothetical protein